MGYDSHVKKKKISDPSRQKEFSDNNIVHREEDCVSKAILKNFYIRCK